MQTKIIATTGEVDLEQQVNAFILNKRVVDIKLTEWVSYKHQKGGYTAFITFEEGPATRQFQIKIIAVTAERDLELQVNQFMSGKEIIDIKFTEWAEYEEQTGGYTALITYVYEQSGQVQQQGAYQQAPQPAQQPTPTPQPAQKSAPQFNAI